MLFELSGPWVLEKIFIPAATKKLKLTAINMCILGPSPPPGEGH